MEANVGLDDGLQGLLGLALDICRTIFQLLLRSMSQYLRPNCQVIDFQSLVDILSVTFIVSSLGNTRVVHSICMHMYIFEAGFGLGLISTAFTCDCLGKVEITS
jgi:hypothetical protein